VTNLLTLVAVPAVQQVSEQGLFGGPFVRLGKLFTVVGSWLFQQGGVLGYTLRQHPLLLSKLIARDPSSFAVQPYDAVSPMKEVADGVIAKAAGKQSGFMEFFVAPELATIDVDLFTFPPHKRLNDKIKAEDASNFMAFFWAKGASVGYHYPDLFRRLWERHYALRPEQEWSEMRARGLALRERQEERPLDSAIQELAETAVGWAEAEAPGLLDAAEVAVLEQLAGSSR